MSDEVVVGSRIDVAVTRRNDAGRDRAAEPERISDGDHPVPHPGGTRVAEPHGVQRRVGFDLEQGEIGLGVAADDPRFQAPIVGQGDGDFVGVGDDVIVGDDVTG